MPNTSQKEIKDLSLDLKNFRTIPQKSEIDAVNAMIAISADRFWALIMSMLEDGYLPTENIIAIRSSESNNKIIVKEGNRRIAGLKLILGYLNLTSFNIPEIVLNKIQSVSVEWKTENSQVPCTVYNQEDSKRVDKIVNLTHGKGDKASRDKWTSIASARHNRDMNKISEPSLDLLEKYFELGKNITDEQKEKWSGDYPITVLDEALKKIIVRIEEKNILDLAAKYPTIKYKDPIEKILSHIGLNNIGFKEVRNDYEDFAEKYGIPQLPPKNATTELQNADNSKSSASKNDSQNTNDNLSKANSTTQNNQSNNTNSTSKNSNTSTNGASSSKSYAINDPRGVTKLLKSFNPSGLNRQKVVTLKNEAVNLKLNKNPIAFCFLLRSMFEISVKAYFNDQNFTEVKNNGKEKTLKEMLNEAKNSLTNSGTNSTLNKELHGAITELNKTAGILSVTSMNQLVHNPTFSIIESDICTLFVQIFPLLKSLN